MTLLLLSLLGCIDETGCTEIAVYSTTISLVDEAGAPIEGATLTYTVDGEEPPLPCEELSGGDYVCGIEADGHFVISAVARGFEAGQAEVDVGADECHPIPEAVTLTLTAVDCTAEVVPSVSVNLSGEGDEVLGNPQVAYTVGDTAAPIACTTEDNLTWACGNDEAGDLVIDAVADGHAAESVPVVVGLDEAECHVVTETLDIELAWLPD